MPAVALPVATAVPMPSVEPTERLPEPILHWRFALETSVLGRMLSVLGLIGVLFFTLIYDASIDGPMGRQVNLSLLAQRDLAVTICVGLMVIGCIPSRMKRIK